MFTAANNQTQYRESGMIRLPENQGRAAFKSRLRNIARSSSRWLLPPRFHSDLGPLSTSLLRGVGLQNGCSSDLGSPPTEDLLPVHVRANTTEGVQVDMPSLQWAPSVCQTHQRPK